MLKSLLIDMTIGQGAAAYFRYLLWSNRKAVRGARWAWRRVR